MGSMTYSPDYTARNSKRGERPVQTQNALARYEPSALEFQRTADRAERLRNAKALRMSARMDESFDADTSGDPFRCGVNGLKNRLLNIREAREVFVLHRDDATFGGMLEGLLLFKVITPFQHKWLRSLRDNAYSLRLQELSQ